jgi:chromosome segregation ATPase
MAEGQIERIKAARERAAERLESSQGQSYDSLQRSEEDLMRRIEKLERVFEQIQDQLRDSDMSSRTMPQAAMQELCVSLSEIQLQLGATRALAKQLEAARQEAEARASSRSSFLGSSVSGGAWNVPSGAGCGDEKGCLSNCASETSPIDPTTMLPKLSGG